MKVLSKDLLVKLLLVVIVGVLTQLTPSLQPYGAIATTITAASVILAPWFYELYVSYEQNKEVGKHIKKYEEEIREFLSSRISFVSKTLDTDFERTDRISVYDGFLQKNFPNLTQTQRNTLILLSLCQTLKHSKSSEQPQIYSLIQNYIELLSIYQITKETESVLSAYYFLFKQASSTSDIEIIFTQQLSESEKKTILDDFINNFSKDAAFIYIRKELKQSEELRKTMVQLINEGELAAYGINQESFEKMQNSLLRNAKSIEAYLILGNKITEDVKQVIKHFPYIGGFASRSGIPRKKGIILVGFIIKPTRHYDNPNEFLEQEIKSKLSGYSKDIMLSVISLDFLRSATWTIPPRAEFSSKYMRDCHAIVDYLGSGYINDVVFWNIITESKIRIEELLSIIPFNIFVPDLISSERNLLIRNYKTLKTKFNIKKLTDWKNINTKELQDAIISLGMPTYTDLESRDLFGIHDSSKIPENKFHNRMQDIAIQIVKNAKKFELSM